MQILSQFVFDQRDQPNPPAPNYGNLKHLEILANIAEFDSLGVAFLLKHSSKLEMLVVSFYVESEQNIVSQSESLQIYNYSAHYL